MEERIKDVEPLTGRDWGNLVQAVEQKRQEAEQTGKYFVTPPPVLLDRTKQFLKLVAPNIREAVKDLTPETRDVVLRDYVGLFIDATLQATPDNVVEFLHNIDNVKAFQTERHAFNFGLWQTYTAFEIHSVDTWLDKATDDGTPINIVAEKKRIANTYTPQMWRWWYNAFRMLYVNRLRQSRVADLELNEDEIREYLLCMCDGLADVSRYYLYYFLAKQCLLATPDELAQIPLPPNQLKANVISGAEDLIRDASIYLENVNAGVAQALDATNIEEKDNTLCEIENRRLTMSHTIMTIISKPIVITSEQKITPITNQFPLQQVVNDWSRNHPKYANEDGSPIITYTILENALIAVNKLVAYKEADKITKRITCNISLEEFARVAGYIDPNQSQLKALLACLLLLNVVYVLVERPLTKIQYEDKNKKPRTRTVGGPSAVNVLHVAEYGLESGDLQISISKEALRGKVLIYENDFNELRKWGKRSVPKIRFYAQILTKDNKKEEELLFEVFGYKEKDKQYIYNHKAEDKKTMAGWFKEFKTTGKLYSYSHTKNKFGVWVYKWKRLEPKKIES